MLNDKLKIQKLAAKALIYKYDLNICHYNLI